MADDNAVEIQFSAATDDALAGIEQVRAALTGLTEPVRGLDGSLGQLSSTFGAALPVSQVSQCVKAFTDMGSAAQRSASQVRTIGTEIQVLRQGLTQRKILLDAEVNQFEITQNQKFALLEAETQKEYDAERALLLSKLSLDDLTVRGRGDVLNRLTLLEAKHRTDMLRLDEQAIQQQQQQWSAALSTVESAFNSQLRGLLAGTTSWSLAFKHILGDIVIKFIEMCESMVVKWLAAELAKTTATTSGAAARAAAEQTGADSGILANIANALKSIFSSAGQTSAEVAAAVAPAAGPAAPAIGAAAGASVVATATGLAGFDLGTDYVLRGGLAVIHQGETIVPALARGSGPFTGAGMGPHISAPVSINVSALDSQSVARFFNDNSKHMLRAINDAVRRGAHLGLRAIRP